MGTWPYEALGGSRGSARAITLMTDGLERGRPPRRVREEVRDGIAVAAFSATASTVLAVVLVALTTLAG